MAKQIAKVKGIVASKMPLKGISDVIRLTTRGYSIENGKLVHKSYTQRADKDKIGEINKEIENKDNKIPKSRVHKDPGTEPTFAAVGNITNPKEVLVAENEFDAIS